MNKEKKKQVNRNRHDFLIEMYFDGVPDGYAVRNVGGWVLVKHFNGGTKRWDVAIYTKESFGKYQEAQQKFLL